MPAAAPTPTPVSAPVPGPIAPMSAPAQLQQPVQNMQATMLDGMLQLQGRNLWPWSDHAQAAVTSALAAAMPAVPQGQVKILETIQASTALCTGTVIAPGPTFGTTPYQLMCSDVYIETSFQALVTPSYRLRWRLSALVRPYLDRRRPALGRADSSRPPLWSMRTSRLRLQMRPELLPPEISCSRQLLRAAWRCALQAMLSTILLEETYLVPSFLHCMAMASCNQLSLNLHVTWCLMSAADGSEGQKRV